MPFSLKVITLNILLIKVLRVFIILKFYFFKLVLIGSGEGREECVMA